MDIPEVDWIVQFDPPDDPRDYIHRVGRTARAGKTGKSLLFLLESELGFLRYLKEAKVPLNEYNFPSEKIANVQTQLEKLLQKNYYLHRSATDGYRSYLQAYASYSLKSIFDVNKLDLVKVGKSFGFTVPPRVNVTVGSAGGESNAAHSKKRRRADVEAEDVEMEDATAEAASHEHRSRPNKERRIEQMGNKRVQKEVYKVTKDRQRQQQQAHAAGDRRQWSR